MLMAFKYGFIQQSVATYMLRVVENTEPLYCEALIAYGGGQGEVRIGIVCSRERIGFFFCVSLKSF